VKPNDGNPPTAHYFSSDPAAPSNPCDVEITLPDLSLTMRSDTGVFSAHKLDPGTKMLLMSTPPPASDDKLVLDLGCGWGPIACVTAARAPQSQVWAIDVNDRALSLTRANAALHGFEDRIHACSPDDVPADLRFDRILSNPPIRVGKPALHALLMRWLDRLTPAGVAHLVVHKHLGSDSLAKWLSARGHDVARIDSRGGYRVLQVLKGQAA